MATDVKKKPELTLKQRLFIDAYVGECRGNATAAATAAGYTGDYKTVQRMGSENLSKPLVKEAIERILTERTLSPYQVLDRLTEHANGTVEHFMNFINDEATLDLGSANAKKYLHLIKKVKTKRRSGGSEQNPYDEVETEFELHDAQAALVHIGRFHKLFDRAPAGVSVTTPSADGKSMVTVSGADATEVQMLAMHNDIIANLLKGVGVELPDELAAPNMVPETVEAEQ